MTTLMYETAPVPHPAPVRQIGAVPGMFRENSKVREVFEAREGNAHICLGNFKNHTAQPFQRSYNDTFLQHKSNNIMYHNDYSAVQTGDYSHNGGLGDTKFGKGFSRKYETSISNPIKDSINEYRKEAEKRGEMLNHERSQNLKRIDSLTGFNIITGELKGTGPKPHYEGKKRLDGSMSEQTLKVGFSALRESKGKFYQPQMSGDAAHSRQMRYKLFQLLLLFNEFNNNSITILFRLNYEGVYRKRCTSIIQLGKEDLPSYGIEDQFNKNEYITKLPEGDPNMRHGVSDMKIPGKYTPRNQPNNPSGHKETVRVWTKSFVLG